SSLGKSSGIPPTTDQHLEPHKAIQNAGSAPQPPVPTSNNKNVTNGAGDSMKALAARAAAVAGAIKTTVGLGETEAKSLKGPPRVVSDVYIHPVAPDRMQSDVSTVPFLPPEKGALTPEEEDIPPPVPLKNRSKSQEYQQKSPVLPVQPP